MKEDDEAKIVRLIPRHRSIQEMRAVAGFGPASPVEGARVLSFPAIRRSGTCFSTSDRIYAVRWVEQAHHLGIAHLVFDFAGDLMPEDQGDYILLYERGYPWASWGVSSTSRGCTLWRATSFRDVGHYATLATTLAALLEVHARLA